MFSTISKAKRIVEKDGVFGKIEKMLGEITKQIETNQNAQLEVREEMQELAKVNNKLQKRTERYYTVKEKLEGLLVE